MKKTELLKLANDDELCEAISDVFIDEILDDDEVPRKRGRYLIRSAVNGDVDGVLIALCGWSLDTLIEKAKAKMNED